MQGFGKNNIKKMSLGENLNFLAIFRVYRRNKPRFEGNQSAFKIMVYIIGNH